MKVKLFDRILLALLLIFVLALAIGLVVFGIRVFPIGNVNATTTAIYGSNLYCGICIGVGVVLFLISFRLLFFGGKARDREHRQREALPKGALVKTTDLGSAFISIPALDAMVQKHCRANSRIRSTKSLVIPVEDGSVNIQIRLTIMPETIIPELVEKLQKTLKEYVEHYSGIMVREVGVLIEDTSIDPKSRVG